MYSSSQPWQRFQQVYICVNTHQIIHFKYVPFVVCHPYLDEAALIRTECMIQRLVGPGPQTTAPQARLRIAMAQNTH